MWFDSWCQQGPIISVVSRRLIGQAGYIHSDLVCDILASESWSWPADWCDRFPILNSIHNPTLCDMPDCVIWKTRECNVSDFSVHASWDSIRPHRDIVPWYHVVWFSQCIPRHSFILWLLIGEKLKTQDMLKNWEINPSISLLCPLCKLVPDSHNHLFFDCVFPRAVL
ncbi:uncharacterized protein [Rutidosis leptorrhynchoides]|uniref:uncharacterized protein n=1 Tax=Rutidosis leptorrhynchoides TaxID=125765 RepID=UPI003A9A190A